MAKSEASVLKQREYVKKSLARGRMALQSCEDMVHEPENPKRRAECKDDFALFARTYFPRLFNLPWSSVHIKVIQKLESAILAKGSRSFAFAMPRGSGKSTLSEIACLWSLLYQHRFYVLLVGATSTIAEKRLKSLKAELRYNELLNEDFSEVTGPIRHMGGSAQAGMKQHYQNVPTGIEWNSDRLVFPSITTPWETVDNALFEVAGLTGDLRGRTHKTSSGRQLRPDLAICDDPQTRASARSPQQTEQRYQTLVSDVAYMAGPDNPISLLVPCTVIEEFDLASQLLDRELTPEFRGEKSKLLEHFPCEEAMQLWEEYAEIRKEDIRNDGDGTAATEFYVTNQTKMDEGAVVSWPERHNAEEHSAVQHCMNLFFKDKAAFYAEYQNEPMDREGAESLVIAKDALIEKQGDYDRNVVPASVTKITFGIDVQQSVIMWVVVGWTDSFEGYVLNYGVFPRQTKGSFTVRHAPRPMMGTYKGHGYEGALRKVLDMFENEILNTVYHRTDGLEMDIDLGTVDIGWFKSKETTIEWALTRRNQVIPSLGRFVGASHLPLNDVRVKPKIGERRGLHWRITTEQKYRRVVFDSNWWKSFVHARLLVPKADRGSLVLFKADPRDHLFFADHLTSEYPVQVSSKERTVDEWRLRPNQENHWLDAIVQAAVAASISGCELPGTAGASNAKRKRNKLKLSEIAARKRTT